MLRAPDTTIAGSPKISAMPAGPHSGRRCLFRRSAPQGTRRWKITLFSVLSAVIAETAFNRCVSQAIEQIAGAKNLERKADWRVPCERPEVRSS
jgi:hypothetical protein